MGTMEGSKIRWVEEPTSSTFSWYCQQHRKYDQIISSDLATRFATLKTHIKDEHGNVEQ